MPGEKDQSELDRILIDETDLGTGEPKSDDTPRRTDTNTPRAGIDTGNNHSLTEHKFKKFNRYATKKTLGSTMLDIGLIMANGRQLKAMVELGPGGQKFFFANVVLIVLSITLQVAAGIVMLILGNMEINTERAKKRANRLNDASLGLILLVTVVNVLISTF